MIIQMIERLHKDEAEELFADKHKALNKKYRITKATVQEAFPEINWGSRS